MIEALLLGASAALGFGLGFFRVRRGAAVSEGQTQNPPPERLITQVFIVREVIALGFVLVWLLLFVGELMTGAYILPFWFHCVAVGTLAYALGVSVATLTSFRDPGRRGDQAGHVPPAHP